MQRIRVPAGETRADPGGAVASCHRISLVTPRLLSLFSRRDLVSRQDSQVAGWGPPGARSFTILEHYALASLSNARGCVSMQMRKPGRIGSPTEDRIGGRNGTHWCMVRARWGPEGKRIRGLQRHSQLIRALGPGRLVREHVGV